MADNPYFMAFLTVYWGMCVGLIAAKHGKNPLLYGFLSLTPLILIVLGIWAFGKFESDTKFTDKKIREVD